MNNSFLGMSGVRGSKGLRARIIRSEWYNIVYSYYNKPIESSLSLSVTRPFTDEYSGRRGRATYIKKILALIKLKVFCNSITCGIFTNPKTNAIPAKPYLSYL